jgi:hypothetical protein
MEDHVTRDVSLSWQGAAAAAIYAVVIAVVTRSALMLVDETWRAFPPPIEPFVYLPLPGAALSGLLLTTKLTQPPRLTAKRVFAVSLGVVVVMTLWFALAATVHTVATNVVSDPGEELGRVAKAVVAVPVLFVAWLLLPGVAVFVVLVPLIAGYAGIMRTITRRGRSGSQTLES